jgi:hypothetical protein
MLLKIRMNEDGFSGIVGIGWVADFLSLIKSKSVVGKPLPVMLEPSRRIVKQVM